MIATKPLLIAALLTLLYPFATFHQQTAKAGSGPMAKVPQKIHHFGSVVAGKMVIHDFIIQNRGSGVLNVTNIKTE